LEDQITIVAVATRHEKTGETFASLTSRTDLTRDALGGRPFEATAKKSRKHALSSAKTAHVESRPAMAEAPEEHPDRFSAKLRPGPGSTGGRAARFW